MKYQYIAIPASTIVSREGNLSLTGLDMALKRSTCVRLLHLARVQRSRLASGSFPWRDVKSTLKQMRVAHLNTVDQAENKVVH